MMHYLPGCDVRKNHPLAMEKLTAYMRSHGAIIDTCCRTRETLMQPGDVMIQNCTMCDLIIRETHPQNTCMSLYEYILQDSRFPFVSHAGERIVVQDCLRTRHQYALQEAVRACLKKMHFEIVEMPEHHEKTCFDGIFWYTKPPQICLEVAPHTMGKLVSEHLEMLREDEQVARMQQWVQPYRDQLMLVYCNACEKGIRLGGGHPVHLVELLAEGLF